MLLGRSGRNFLATLLGCLSPFLAARSTTWGIVGDFGGPLPRVYPLVVPDLRIVVHGRIRELVHGRVVSLTVAVFLALASLPVRGQRSRASRAVIVAVALCPCAVASRLVAVFLPLLLSTCALSFSGRQVSILGSIPVSPLTTLGVTGRGCLTATSHIVSVRVSLPAGEIGVTARGPTLSRVALVPAHGHAGDNLRERAGENERLARRDPQEGAEAVVSQPPAVSEVSVAVTPAAGGAALSALPSAVWILPGSF